jgi:hypothetical protein
MTYDGYIAAAPGALVVLDRDLNVKSYVTFSGGKPSITASPSMNGTASTSSLPDECSRLSGTANSFGRDLPWLGHDAHLDGFWRR